MYRIRFHGRGGQGMKTAGRILGTAFFLEGFHVQDAPRYGAERRGAPIFAFVRVSSSPINERGIIHVPDLVIVADGTLLDMPAAQVMDGCADRCVVLTESDETPEYWKLRLNFQGTLIAIPCHHIPHHAASPAELSSFWAGTSARLCRGVSKQNLDDAVRQELAPLGNDAVARGLELATAGWDLMAHQEGAVAESGQFPAMTGDPPEWVTMEASPVRYSAPAVRTPATSVRVKTGLWRTNRPVINYDACKQCWWNCTVFCPDSVISVNPDGHPVIDYEHCKGCLVCAEECRGKAITAMPENTAGNNDKGGY